MGHTNSTANLALPQFIGTDKPTWLGDVNGAFSAIDAYAGTNDAAVAAAASDASSAITQASAAVNTANTANTTAGNASTTANNAIGVANTANAIAGTVDAKVGLLADLNTTDRSSIVNAINEVAANAGSKTLKRTINTDGTSTYTQIFNQFAADLADITDEAYIVYDYGTGIKDYFRVNRITSSDAGFSYISLDSTDLKISYIKVSAASTYITSTNGNINDASTSAPAAGRSYSLYV